MSTARPATPTVAPSGLVARIAVQSLDNSVLLVDAMGNQTLFAKLDNPVDPASRSAENTFAGDMYLPVTGNPSSVIRVGADGSRQPDWITGPLYGIAASSSRLAWGTADIRATMMAARIQLSGLDGSGVKIGLEEVYSGVQQVLSPLRWSKDGAQLYFSKEPLGLGGYILFGGRTNLWALDVNSGRATELVPQRAKNAAICIDDLAPNEKLVADHCSMKTIEVINLTDHTSVAINPPIDVPSLGIVGGARFSPDSSRLAYALARNDPNDEQGRVAVSDGLNGTSKLIATSPAKDYFEVSAWLDADTIVLQSATPPQGVWIVRADGVQLKRLADGMFLGVVGDTL